MNGLAGEYGLQQDVGHRGRELLTALHPRVGRDLSVRTNQAWWLRVANECPDAIA